MSITQPHFPSRALLALLFLASYYLPVHASDVTPENLVAHHLDSIGTSEARAAVKSRVVQGKLKFTILVGGGGSVEGSWGLVSEQRKSNLVMRFSTGNWRGEQFVCNGEKVYVAAETASLTRSLFGDFVHSQDYIIQEGLLGGELSTGWALANLDANHPKLSYDGVKKIDGQEVYDLAYRSKHSSDMQIHLYFDPATYHHVKTVYRMAIVPNIGTDITASSIQREIRYTVEERFKDFKTVNGLTLPSTYSIEYTEELQNGQTRAMRWDMNIDKSAENVGLDPKNFDTH